MKYKFNPFLGNLDLVEDNHGNLTGLTDDDHTQYILADGTRAFTGNQSFGDFNIINVGDISLDSISADLNSITVILGTSAGNDFIVGNNTFVVEGDNDRIGIGTNAPSHLLTLGTPGTLHSGSTMLSLCSNDATPEVSMHQASNFSTQRFGISMIKSRGSISSPSVVANGDRLGFLGFKGYDGNATQLPALIEAYVDGTPSVGSVPARISFTTGSNGSTRAERLVIKNNGDIGIGTATPTAVLDINGDVNITSTLDVGATETVDVTDPASNTAIDITLTRTTATANILSAVSDTLKTTHTTGTIEQPIGYFGGVKLNSNGTVTQAYGVFGDASIVDTFTPSVTLLIGTRGGVDANDGTVTSAISILGEAPSVDTGTITNSWAGYFHDDVQLDSDKKLILEGNILSKGDTYFVYDSIGTTLDCFVNGTEVWNASSAQLECLQNIKIGDAKNIILNTTTGTKIGTATNQKLAFFNSTPIIQQTTTSQTPATFTANTSGISDDTATWNGYTIGDIVAILQAYGLLA